MRSKKISRTLARINLVAGPAIGILLACWIGKVSAPLPWPLQVMVVVAVLGAGSLAGIVLWRYTIGLVIAVVIGGLMGLGIIKDN